MHCPKLRIQCTNYYSVYISEIAGCIDFVKRGPMNSPRVSVAYIIIPLLTSLTLTCQNSGFYSRSVYAHITFC